jgi:hypothetical protein
MFREKTKTAWKSLLLHPAERMNPTGSELEYDNFGVKMAELSLLEDITALPAF